MQKFEAPECVCHTHPTMQLKYQFQYQNRLHNIRIKAAFQFLNYKLEHTLNYKNTQRFDCSLPNSHWQAKKAPSPSYMTPIAPQVYLDRPHLLSSTQCICTIQVSPLYLIIKLWIEIICSNMQRLMELNITSLVKDINKLLRIRCFLSSHPSHIIEHSLFTHSASCNFLKFCISSILLLNNRILTS